MRKFEINLILMLFVISIGFFILIYSVIIDPVRLRQGESLCLKYSSFHRKKIVNAKIISIIEVDSDHGALELQIKEDDSIYLIRIYEEIYDGFKLENKEFNKSSNSFDLKFSFGEVYKLIRTCDEFLE
ncbi:hypothetical protein [Algoriphagus confluentis]|uniref:Uncharacterized protein n=1 Tax=Algoriphagus confluentis TaxID=1697556 RepID=A0ABQ6PV57_9BACT|nr:hypothetical protein Aconfl_32650 [Algoriphagus confluentis]